MLLKLKESIITGGEHYAPPKVIDTELLKISDAEALVLVRRGTAEHHTADEQPSDEQGGPEVTKIQTIENGGDKPADTNLVEGRLAVDGMNKAELVAMATEMGIDTAGKNKAELIEAIKAQPVFAENVEGEGEQGGQE